ncbi:hypothetical protein PPACK8108_LOCUS2695 [Phakopsora pachyrhizi]|uniref:Uncharacterized protein n=1 Tax=Phakopsora pachyrhizi TaxID=170000 RepID=A0AAV0AKZ7_PHAPC|nr:hypothetical protein PPACK8108_LOCUS2695 [Phakopsora pachyrhizi]
MTVSAKNKDQKLFHGQKFMKKHPKLSSDVLKHQRRPLLGDDPIKQHDLEYFHQVGEYPLMRTNNEGEIATIYPDFTASYKPQQPDMQFNHYESAGVHSPDTQSSSFNWPSIEEWLGSGSNEALENIGVGDFKSNIGNISYNIENENLDDPHNKENSMIIGSGEIPSFFFKENLNDINGGIISEGGFPSLHELSQSLQSSAFE